MKTMTIFQARNHFTQTIKTAQKDVVIVTQHGKPVAAIQAITEDDLEDLMLERSDKFWTMIRKARKGRGVPLAQARRKLKA